MTNHKSTDMANEFQISSLIMFDSHSCHFAAVIIQRTFVRWIITAMQARTQGCFWLMLKVH